MIGQFLSRIADALPVAFGGGRKQDEKKSLLPPAPEPPAPSSGPIDMAPKPIKPLEDTAPSIEEFERMREQGRQMKPGALKTPPPEKEPEPKAPPPPPKNAADAALSRLGSSMKAPPPPARSKGMTR